MAAFPQVLGGEQRAVALHLEPQVRVRAQRDAEPVVHAALAPRLLGQVA